MQKYQNLQSFSEVINVNNVPEIARVKFQDKYVILTVHKAKMHAAQHEKLVDLILQRENSNVNTFDDRCKICRSENVIRGNNPICNTCVKNIDNAIIVQRENTFYVLADWLLFIVQNETKICIHITDTCTYFSESDLLSWHGSKFAKIEYINNNDKCWRYICCFCGAKQFLYQCYRLNHSYNFVCQECLNHHKLAMIMNWDRFAYFKEIIDIYVKLPELEAMLGNLLLNVFIF